MDNNKIGDLIKNLRKEKGYTQEQLGDIVGVGFRSVSKWERGETIPDISIIYTLAEVLGITTDELLAGELNTGKDANSVQEITNDDKQKLVKKKRKRKNINILIISIIVSVVFLIVIYFKYKTSTYDFIADNQNDYIVSGKFIYSNDDLIIVFNQLSLNNEELNNSQIKYLEFDFEIKDVFYYNLSDYDAKQENNRTKSLFKILYKKSFFIDTQNTISINAIKASDIKLYVHFYDEFDNEYNEEIKIVLK